jgi:hypothetical protein
MWHVQAGLGSSAEGREGTQGGTAAADAAGDAALEEARVALSNIQFLFRWDIGV